MSKYGNVFISEHCNISR